MAPTRSCLRQALELATMLSLLLGSAHAQSIDAMSYNIRYDNPDDGENSWELRKAGLVNQLRFYAPDLFGIQEGEYQQVRYIDEALPEFAWVGVGREDGLTGGEFSAIYYDTRRLKVLQDSTFWLSDTPAEVSIGWDAAIKRVCTYALFEDLASSQKFWVFNTHFDHIGVMAREQSAMLIRAQIARINEQDYPVLLMGDFNAEPDSKPIATLTASFEDASTVARLRFGPDGTRGGFYVAEPITRRIDFIFTSPGDWEVLKYAVLSDSLDMKYYSDHLPVFVEVALRIGAPWPAGSAPRNGAVGN
ncbi:MAG: endonuclease/exonuclease/phosphatase family protein [Gammaproteobacteria bacterium]|nr:endonuclease/exonuclease/phosphatase family protein [Gammaproteobacteria bacterium]MDH5304662.1 endonuclease/exonuclease/phosphatase family protein [Gammaproteobacteria bacterium]MDH5323009.1 endonuclease/exonuclease/phosphatase family protein [Gammaproteobacteria bacterium]